MHQLTTFIYGETLQLDYAARDRDGAQVWQCYENIVVAVNDIISRL